MLHGNWLWKSMSHSVSSRFSKVVCEKMARKSRPINSISWARRGCHFILCFCRASKACPYISPAATEVGMWIRVQMLPRHLWHPLLTPYLHACRISLGFACCQWLQMDVIVTGVTMHSRFKMFRLASDQAASPPLVSPQRHCSGGVMVQ